MATATSNSEVHNSVKFEYNLSDRKSSNQGRSYKYGDSVL